MEKISESSDAQETKSRNQNLTRIALLLLLTGVLLLLSWIGWKAWRIYQTTTSLFESQAQIEKLTDGGFTQIDPDTAESIILGLRGDILSLKQDVGFILPILPSLSELPRIGALAAATPALLEMADAGTEASAYAIRGLKPALIEMQKEDRSERLIPQLLEVIDAAQPDLAKAGMALDRVAEARAKIPEVESLPWRVRNLLSKGDEWLSTGQEFARISLVLPEIMGHDKSRRYLVLAQNQDELRATGGFISGVGFIEIDDGKITKLDFDDANLVDAWEQPGAIGGRLIKPYSEPPAPLKEFMLLDLFLFRDANFWPDFAVSAQKAMDLYAYGRDIPPLDGAIGINQEFLKLLLTGLGPVKMDGSNKLINSNNVIQSLQEAWTLQDGVSDRKAFFGPFAAAIQHRAYSEFADIDPLNLIRQLSQSLDQKDLQLYIHDPFVTEMLAANNWDGRLRSPHNHDSLMVVDTNMGYNKANFLVEREMTYDVLLAPDGENIADLKITHKHLGEDIGEDCQQGVLEEYVEGALYTALTDKCYWNYLRVYVPEDSQLIEGPQHLIPGDSWFGGYDWQLNTETLAELPGFTTFASWMLLPRGQEISSNFQYRLPDSITQEIDGIDFYRLYLSKQAGTGTQQVQVSVTPPPGTTVIGVSPEPVSIKNMTYIFAVELDRDQMVSLAYQHEN